jgi:hypothetical protein
MSNIVNNIRRNEFVWYLYRIIFSLEFPPFVGFDENIAKILASNIARFPKKNARFESENGVTLDGKVVNKFDRHYE